MNDLKSDLKAHPIVTVSVPAKLAANLKDMEKLTANVLGKLGCPGCHSGFDIRFRQELEFVANAHGEVRALHELVK
ncbi:MAG: hypothetical protein AB7T06_44785 [Kofleriaceae bacterium]